MTATDYPLPLSVEAVCNALPLGMFIVDHAMRVHYWNTWMAGKTGISSADALGKSLQELFPDMNSNRLISAVQQTTSNGMAQSISRALHSYVIPMASAYGRHHGIPLMQQEVSVTPVNTEGGKILALVSLRDVTEKAVRESALASIIQRLKQESTRDPLTGVFNQRFMWDWLEVQLKRSTRQQHSLACLMADIDCFKAFNDNHGHQAGDLVLKEFSDRLVRRMRKSDVVVRYGGEEFVLLLPECSLIEAKEAAKAVHSAVSDTPFTIPDVGSLQIQCSVGVSMWQPDHPCTAEDLIRRADKLLYRAKRAGRNRVITENVIPIVQEAG